MIDLEHTILEVASNFSENEVATTQKNVEALSQEISTQDGMAKLIMIAWDQG